MPSSSLERRAGTPFRGSRAAAGPLRILVLSAGLVLGGSTASAQLPPVPVPPENPLTEPKRILGKILFWEEQLSSDNTTACGTCHLPASAGSDPRPATHPGFDETFLTADDVFGSPGVRRANTNNVHVEDPLFGFEVQVTSRSAPSFFGTLWAPETFWDGRAGGAFVDPQTGEVSIAAGGALESQALGPILSDVEMANEERTWDQVIAKLEAASPMALASDLPADVAAALDVAPDYPALFAAAFGDPAITAERIALAIASYERTLVAGQTPWDRFQAGDASALTPAQLAGWNFLQGSRCVTCHAPPLFTDDSFRNIGVRPPAEDTGRFGVTGVQADLGRFKVPTLRNVGLKPSFMHNGRFVSLQQVLDFYQGINGQQMFPQNLDPLVAGGIAVPRQLRGAVIDFLANGLTDPRVAAGLPPFDRPTLRGARGLCDDGLDNDGDGAADLADGDCVDPTDSTEQTACGLGFEVAPFLVALGAWRRRRSDRSLRRRT